MAPVLVSQDRDICHVQLGISIILYNNTENADDENNKSTNQHVDNDNDGFGFNTISNDSHKIYKIQEWETWKLIQANWFNEVQCSKTIMEGSQTELDGILAQIKQLIWSLQPSKDHYISHSITHVDELDIKDDVCIL